MSHATSSRQQGQVAVVTMDDGNANAAGFVLFEALRQALDRATDATLRAAPLSGMEQGL